MIRFQNVLINQIAKNLLSFPKTWTVTLDPKLNPFHILFNLTKKEAEEIVALHVGKTVRASEPIQSTSANVDKQKKLGNGISQEEVESPVINKKLIIALIITIVFAVLAIGIILQSRAAKKQEQLVSNSTVILPSVSPTALQESSVSSSLPPLPVLSKYQVSVLNGSGTAGIATEVANILLAEGFKTIDTGNADSFDSVTTEVRLKQAISDEVFDAIERALNSDYEITRSVDFLTADDEYDVVVIVGQKK